MRTRPGSTRAQVSPEVRGHAPGDLNGPEEGIQMKYQEVEAEHARRNFQGQGL